MNSEGLQRSRAPAREKEATNFCPMMNNDELQAAIIATDDLIQRCDPKAPRYTAYVEHQEYLIAVQRKRAAVMMDPQFHTPLDLLALDLKEG